MLYDPAYIAPPPDSYTARQTETSATFESFSQLQAAATQFTEHEAAIHRARNDFLEFERTLRLYTTPKE